MNYLSPLVVICVLFFMHPCTAQSIDAAAIPGQYVFKSLQFDSPVDINKDGKSSRQYEAEADACAIDMRYQLNADGTGTCTIGMQGKDCKKQERAIKWKIKTGKLKGSAASSAPKTYLVISDADGFDPTPFEIVEQTKKKLIIRGEFRDGSDSTSPGNLELIKQKQ